LEDLPPEEDPEAKKQKEKASERLVAAIQLHETLLPQFPVEFIVQALEKNNDNADNAVNWLFENGEKFLFG
jgi:hypothetical protein